MELNQLLIQISDISKKHEKEFKSSGHIFNIFNILNLSASENIHSKFISELLNPNGTHGKGNLFLDLFLKCIKADEFSAENVIVETEKFIGYISNDYDSGGRIDISIKNGKNQYIFIENKIFAYDQRNQLLRYSKYKPDAKLYYLTLSGSEPGDYSTGSINFNYELISYKENLLNWIELCKEESTDNPLLHETLTQYIVLIKQLTGQTWSNEVENKIIDLIIKDADNVSATFELHDNLDKIKIQIIKNKFLPIIEKLANKKELELDAEFDRFYEKCQAGFSLYKKEWNKLRIDFLFDSTNFNHMFYGLGGLKIPEESLEKYKKNFDFKYSVDWPLWKFMDIYRHWDKDFFLKLYTDEKHISDIFENKIDELISIINENFALKS